MVNSKLKGKRGELELVHFLQNLGVHARRTQQYSGTEGAADVASNLPVHWEVKRTESLRLHQALSQAINDSPPNLIPVVAHRKNHQEWIASLRLIDLVHILDPSTLTHYEHQP